MKNTNLLAWLIVIIAFMMSLVSYFFLPDVIDSHWNAKGEADGTMGKFWGVMLMPLTLLFLQLFFIAIPKIDPLKKNYSQFREMYDKFVLMFLLFMFLIDIHIIIWNFGMEINPNIFMPIALGFFFYYAGELCGKAKRNWFVGMRTPWTLSSDIVWEKTHKLTAKLFKICGGISILAAFTGEYAIYIALAPIVLVSLFLFLYSYLIYRKEEKKENQ